MFEKVLTIITFIFTGIALALSILMAYGFFWLTIQILKEVKTW